MADEALAQVRLTEHGDRKASQLSGGSGSGSPSPAPW